MNWYYWKLGSLAWTRYKEERETYDGDGRWLRLVFGLCVLVAPWNIGRGRR